MADPRAIHKPPEFIDQSPSVINPATRIVPAAANPIAKIFWIVSCSLNRNRAMMVTKTGALH